MSFSRAVGGILMSDRGLVIPFIMKQEEKEEETMVDYKLNLGGKEPPVDGNWLTPLEIGTIFLIQDKTNADFNLGHFKLVDKTEKACILASSVLPQPIFVNPFRFCQKYNIFENLGIMKEEDIKEEEDTIREPNEEEYIREPNVKGILTSSDNTKEDTLVLSDYLIKKEEDSKKE